MECKWAESSQTHATDLIVCANSDVKIYETLLFSLKIL